MGFQFRADVEIVASDQKMALSNDTQPDSINLSGKSVVS